MWEEGCCMGIYVFPVCNSDSFLTLKYKDGL